MKSRKLKCFICYREGHFKKDCLERKKKESNKQVDLGEADLVSDGYKSVEVLTISSQDTIAEGSYTLVSRSTYVPIDLGFRILTKLMEVRFYWEITMNVQWLVYEQLS